LWSVHPRYLDTAGLTACWREALLAQKVLTGVTRGYRRHPQLERFLPGSALEPQPGLEPRAALEPRNRPDASARRTDPDETSAMAVAGVVAGVAGVAGGATVAGVAVVAGAAAVVAGAAAAGVRASAGGWPGDRIVAYLHGIADEADARGFAFDRSRVAGRRRAVEAVEVVEITDGQLAREWVHLLAKLANRSPDVAARWADVVHPDPHPCFVVVPGPVAPWEVVPGA
jgi:hypothetical protein